MSRDQAAPLVFTPRAWLKWQFPLPRRTHRSRRVRLSDEKDPLLRRRLMVVNRPRRSFRCRSRTPRSRILFDVMADVGIPPTGSPGVAAYASGCVGDAEPRRRRDFPPGLRSLPIGQ